MQNYEVESVTARVNILVDCNFVAKQREDGDRFVVNRIGASSDGHKEPATLSSLVKKMVRDLENFKNYGTCASGSRIG